MHMKMLYRDLFVYDESALQRQKAVTLSLVENVSSKKNLGLVAFIENILTLASKSPGVQKRFMSFFPQYSARRPFAFVGQDYKPFTCTCNAVFLH